MKNLNKLLKFCLTKQLAVDVFRADQYDIPNPELLEKQAASIPLTRFEDLSGINGPEALLDVVEKFKADELSAFLDSAFDGSAELKSGNDLCSGLVNMPIADLHDLLFIDPTTKILNRTAFERKKHGGVFGIIDLDSLKWVNDNLDHRAGDRLLSLLAAHLVEVFEFKNVFRLSGDEFVVLIDDENDVLALDSALRKICPPIYSFATGSDLRDCDNALKTVKQWRIITGLRAARGERPPWHNSKFLKGEHNVH
jgi:GGDEF domain-containing protein